MNLVEFERKNDMTPFNFYLVTDTHYFENSLCVSGKAFDQYMKTEQYFMEESASINKAIFNQIAEDTENEIVLMPGDLSKNGEIESHKSLIKELYKLRDAGKKIFVITAGHDYNEYSRGFVNDECVQVEGTKFEELYNLYYDFGYSEAIAVDKQTLSYVAEIAPKVHLLAVNCDSDEKNKGAIDDRLMQWLQIQIDDAKNNGCFIFGINHYPIIPPVPVFDLFGDTKVKEWRKVATFFADNGVNLFFTGHMHIQSINEFVTDNGNKFYDVCTSCSVGSPAKYRKVTINEDGVADIKSLDVPDFGWDTKGLSLQEYFDNQFAYSIVGRVERIFNGGKGFSKILKTIGKKFVFSVKVGTIARLLWIRVDKSLKKVKFIDLIGNLGCEIFKGDLPHTPGTPLYEALSKVFKRFNFIIKKVEPKLSKNSVNVDLVQMLLNTIGNNKELHDNNEMINLG